MRRAAPKSGAPRARSCLPRPRPLNTRRIYIIPARPLHGGRGAAKPCAACSMPMTGIAYSAAWPSIVDWMQMYFGEPVMLTKAHHNCIMTKHPVYGSLTGWHRDARYWSFKRNNLISAWLALESETVRNGALRFVPGSHRIALPSDCFDHAQFFHARPEHHPE